MSPTSLRVLKGQVQRGIADLDTIDVWEQKKTVTPAEAELARAYWHELYDPPPPPPEPAAQPAEDQAPESTGEPPAGG